MKLPRVRWTPVLLIYFAFTGLFLFLYGFFPLKYHGGSEATWNDLPAQIGSKRIDPIKSYKGNRTRVVLMVIDALRYDFTDVSYMPYTGKMIKEGKACLHQARAEPPTVTMPRIKAMTTGSISNFIDVALNFGSSAVAEDSFIHQAKLNNKNMVFYGDDTWLRLFPNKFIRSEGTTSFYVSDFTEVDLNVTRNLPKELAPKNPDWDMMILHYLGLDHIGHLEGPFSSKVKPKMIEMDNVVQLIMNATKNWDDDTVLIICGDHGMKDSGGHGGASYSETTVPLVLFQKKGCDPKLSDHINQVDVAPTISYILGIPIPSSNTGQILLQVLSSSSGENLSSEKSLYALNYNSKVNFDAFVKILGTSDALNKEVSRSYYVAIHQHEEFLIKKDNSGKRVLNVYLETLSNMSEYLIKSVADFDMFAIMIGIAIIFHTFVAQLANLIMSFIDDVTIKSNIPKKKTLSNSVLTILAFFVGLFIFKVLCGVSQTGSSLCKNNPFSLLTVIAVILTVISNFSIMRRLFKNLPDSSDLGVFTTFEKFIMIATNVYPFTFGGTSFIEEEHQTWYFFWTSVMILMLAYTGKIVFLYYQKKRENATEIQDKDALLNRISTTAKVLLPMWIALMILHRFLRKLNQTGDKWAFLPDTGDWLNKDTNIEILSTLYLAALLTVIIICMKNLTKTIAPFILTSLLVISSAVCIYLYRATTRTIQIPLIGYLDLNEVYLVRLFWILLLFIVLIEAWSSWITFSYEYRVSSAFMKSNDQNKVTNTLYAGLRTNETKERYKLDRLGDFKDDSIKNDKGCFKTQMLCSRLYTFLNVMMLVCSLYMRPHNLLLIPSIYITSYLVNMILDFKLNALIRIKENSQSKIVFFKTLFHFWIGSVFFFYQGNSNSLASVDLSPGYIGLESYIPPIVALQMAVHTYTGPILAGILLFSNLSQSYREWNTFIKHLRECLSVFALLRTYTLLIYTIVCTILRYHLFVWTVFSPKLLYEFVLTVLTVVSFIVMMLLCKSIEWQENLSLIKVTSSSTDDRFSKKYKN